MSLLDNSAWLNQIVPIQVVVNLLCSPQLMCWENCTLKLAKESQIYTSTNPLSFKDLV